MALDQPARPRREAAASTRAGGVSSATAEMSATWATRWANCQRANAAAVENQYSFCDQPPTLGGSKSIWPRPAIVGRTLPPLISAGVIPSTRSAPTTYSVGCLISPVRRGVRDELGVGEDGAEEVGHVPIGRVGGRKVGHHAVRRS